MLRAQRAPPPQSASTTVRPRSQSSHTPGPSAFKPQRQPRASQPAWELRPPFVQSCGHPPSGVWLQPEGSVKGAIMCPFAHTRGVMEGEVCCPLPSPSPQQAPLTSAPQALALTLYSFLRNPTSLGSKSQLPPSPSVWPQQPLNVPMGSPLLYLVINAQKHGLTTVTIMSAVPEFMGPQARNLTSMTPWLLPVKQEGTVPPWAVLGRPILVPCVVLSRC